MRVHAGEQRPRRRRAPPAATAHAWQKAAAGPAAFFIDMELAKRLERQAVEAAGEGSETMALLRGDVFASPSGGPTYAAAFESASAPLRASATHVQFDREQMDELAKALDDAAFDYLTVGWFHTHLGIGARPSATDESTQARFFSLEHQVALIFDPVRKEAAAFRLVGGALAATPVGVFDSREDGGEPWRRPKS
ncbi:MAG TPA: hypothetical protein VI796_04550 [Candidatus Thermoplasmatota archaeon]|nr:hypothetical protein [Candidatus Thermoplasmatota archaeon]